MGEGHGQLGPQARRDSHPCLWARPCLGVLPDEVRGWCAWPSFVICTCGKPQSGSLQLVKTQSPPLTHQRSTPLVPDPSLLQEHLATLPTPPQPARVTPLPSRQLPCNPVASNKHKLRMTWAGKAWPLSAQHAELPDPAGCGHPNLAPGRSKMPPETQRRKSH